MIRRIAILLVIFSFPTAAWSAPRTEQAIEAAELRQHATQYSIGIEWDVRGDANHNATCHVQYRAKGADAWKPALPLFRIDFHGWYGKTKADRAYNMFAGSIFFLQPGTAYEVKLEMTDPDGGAASKTLAIATRPLPRAPEGGKTYHVVPGNGGGDGSRDKPFQGLSAAQQAAQPGDVVLVRSGNYGAFQFEKAGAVDRFIAWIKDGDGEATFSFLEVAASHLYLEGFTFRKDDKESALRARGAVKDVALSHCSFTGFHHSIMLNRECQDWYIADNTIVGDNDPDKSTLHGEGIDLAKSPGHVVSHNRVSRTENGVHYPLRNCDIFGNDIFDTSDDGLECDYGYANIRVWENRVSNFKNNGLSFQPQYCGPWYFIRNQVIGRGYLFKFRVQDRFVLANNTFVTWSFASPRMHHILTSLSRNNLYICGGKPERAPIWTAHNSNEDETQVRRVEFKPNWMTDVDYDGFDWGDGPAAFRWDKRTFKDLPSFVEAVGIERHGIRVSKEQIFEKFDLPAPPARVGPVVLTLKKGCNAIDAGAVLPNINDDFAGKAPDLGAHEFGKPVLTYGPRARTKR